MINYRHVRDDTKAIWTEIEKGMLTKSEVRIKIFKINEEIQKEKVTSVNSILLYEFSQSLLRLYSFLDLTMDLDEDLKVSTIMLKNKGKEPVYYIFNKEAVRIFATKLNWFFPLYNKLEIIEESKTYILLKEEKISVLSLTANLILNKNKEPIYEKYFEEQSAREYYNSLKN